MKKFIGISAFLFLVGFSSVAHAQEKDSTTGQEIKADAKKAGHKIKHGAQKVGNETAKVASEAKSTVVDQVYKDKTGPNGETIYIDKHSKYYWVDDKGHKRYTTKAQLKDKNG